MATPPRSDRPRTTRERPGERRTARDIAYEVLASDTAWDTLALLVYGSFGVGKTWLAGTAIQDKRLAPVMLIDNDGGSRTLRGKGQFAGIKILRVYKFEAYNEIYKMLADKPNAFKTVIIDNLTEVHNMAMQLEMERVCRDDPSREPNVPSRREYGIVRAELHKLVNYFLELPINLIVTCHANLMQDEVDGRTYIRPALSGKLSFEIPGKMAIVGYLATERVSKIQQKKGEDISIARVMTFQPIGRIDAKDQSDALGITLENPTIPQIAKLVGVLRDGTR